MAFAGSDCDWGCGDVGLLLLRDESTKLKLISASNSSSWESLSRVLWEGLGAVGTDGEDAASCVVGVPLGLMGDLGDTGVPAPKVPRGNETGAGD